MDPSEGAYDGCRWIGPPCDRSGAPERPDRCATISANTDSASLLGGAGAQVETDRTEQVGEVVGVDVELGQPIAPLGLGAPGAEGADVADVASHRRGDDRRASTEPSWLSITERVAEG